MNKRLISLVCVLALLLSLNGNIGFSVFAVENSGGNQFLAGFSRVDINPYVVDGDINSGIMQLPLRGTGDVWNRISTKGLMDDNGDGKIDEEDGLAVTCIAVSDADGNTILLLTIDLIGGGMIAKVRSEILTRVEAALASGELKNIKLSAEGIHYAGTHTHEAPDTTVYNASGKTGTNNAGLSLKELNENLGIWIERTIEDIGDAAILALKDLAPATLTKDALSASQATADAVRGRTMNSVRHYVAADKGCVAGDNFNNRGSDPKQVTPVNDNMYLLKFDFPGGDKLPIVLCNWRGHPSMNNTNDELKSSKNGISADYPNAFRYTLEYNCTVNRNGTVVNPGKQVYRVAFFNGEGGNVNPRAREKTNGVANYQWFEDLADNLKESRGNVYGRVLAAMAQECLATPENRQAVRYGAVRSTQYVYNSVRKDTGYTELSYEAALEYQAQAAVKTMSHPWKYTSPTTGEFFVIGSKFHASNIISNWQVRFGKPLDSLVDMELDAMMIGPDVAIVTAPGEPFDYYFNEDGSNAWKNLVDDTYGTPFVLGYCNGAKGYIPNYKAYDYNLGSTKWQRGSYESAITPYAQGSGEHMIDLFESMLEGLVSGTCNVRNAYCQHCKTTVDWKPYTGIDTLQPGHYYLLEDAMVPQIHLADNATVCFDLNGHTIKGETRAFYTKYGGNTTLNLMDNTPEQKGAALGCGGSIGAASGYGGGGMIIDKGNVLNFYSGNIGMYEKPYNSVHRGGVLRVGGTVNMYGGTVLGGTVSSFRGDYVTSGNALATTTKDAVGATVCNTGTFRIYGGRIEGGRMETVTGAATPLSTGKYRYSETRTPLEGISYGVYTSGKFIVAGNAAVEELCIDGVAGELFIVDNAALPFDGYVQLNFMQYPEGGRKVGTVTGDMPLTEGSVMLANGSEVTRLGADLMISQNTGGGEFCLTDSLGSASYVSLSGAYAAYQKRNSVNGVITLMSDSGDDLLIGKDVTLDLNGCYITGSITVSDGVTLFCKDSQTDDFTVNDAYGYGMMPNVAGNMTAASGYLKITEKDRVSFHRVELGIDTMSLRPSAVSLYYRSPFKGDEVVAAHVRSFGICLSVENGTAAQAMTPGTYTVYTDFVPGAGGNQTASTMVSGIMKTGNTTAVNAANAETMIYGCAYLQTDEGFVFGETVGMTLRQQVEGVDKIWRTLTDRQRDFVLALRFRYSAVVEKWKVPNILS